MKHEKNDGWITPEREALGKISEKTYQPNAHIWPRDLVKPIHGQTKASRIRACLERPKTFREIAETTGIGRMKLKHAMQQLRCGGWVEFSGNVWSLRKERGPKYGRKKPIEFLLRQIHNDLLALERHCSELIERIKNVRPK